MNQAILIFKKELKEMLRDKRVVYNAVFGPIFLIFLMVYAFGFVIESVSKDVKRTLHVVGSQSLPPFLESPETKIAFDIKRVDTKEAGLKLINDGKADLLLEVLPPETGVVSAFPQQVIEAYFDNDRERPKITLAVLQKLIQMENEKSLVSTLEAKNVPKSAMEPIKLDEKPIASPAANVGGFLAGFLPYIIVMWAFYGASGSAAETVAGEKEKNTLETLLIVPVERTQIALGKFIGLTCLSSISIVSAFVGLVVTAAIGGSRAKALFPEGVHFTFGSIVTIILIALPMAAMFAGILLALSTRARNMRECQTQLALVSFVVITPAVFSQFIGMTSYANAAWVNFVPILNTATVLKSALLGKTDWSAIGITVGISLALAYLTTMWAVRLFRREEVLAKI